MSDGARRFPYRKLGRADVATQSVANNPVAASPAEVGVAQGCSHPLACRLAGDTSSGDNRRVVRSKGRAPVSAWVHQLLEKLGGHTTRHAPWRDELGPAQPVVRPIQMPTEVRLSLCSPDVLTRAEQVSLDKDVLDLLRSRQDAEANAGNIRLV